MRVTVSIAAEDDRVVSLEEPTYGDLLTAVGLSPQAAAAIVEGHPVPADAPVETDWVEVVRLISGG